MAEPQPSPLARRTLLRGAGGGVVAATWLVACGSDDEPSAGSDSTTPPESEGGGSGGDGGGGNGGGNGGGEPLTSTADVAVGGGVIVDEKYVVTQPTKGDFKAFSAVCTHQGCVLASVSDNTIQCNCHGSAFSAEDGSVVNGPATQPLAEEQITVQGDEVLLG